MITIIKKDLVGEIDGEKYFVGELRGLSTDIKPIEIENKKIGNGSIYICVDTGEIYIYDLENQQWNKI